MASARRKTEEERDRAKKGIKARNDAVQYILAKYKDEFDTLVEKNRVDAGLPRLPAGPSEEKLRERQQKLEEQLAKIRKTLGDS